MELGKIYFKNNGNKKLYFFIESLITGLYSVQNSLIVDSEEVTTDTFWGYIVTQILSQQIIGIGEMNEIMEQIKSIQNQKENLIKEEVGNIVSTQGS